MPKVLKSRLKHKMSDGNELLKDMKCDLMANCFRSTGSDVLTELLLGDIYIRISLLNLRSRLLSRKGCPSLSKQFR